MIMHFRVPMDLLRAYIELVLSSGHSDLTDDLFMDFFITRVTHFLDINFSVEKLILCQSTCEIDCLFPLHGLKGNMFEIYRSN